MFFLCSTMLLASWSITKPTRNLELAWLASLVAEVTYPASYPGGAESQGADCSLRRRQTMRPARLIPGGSAVSGERRGEARDESEDPCPAAARCAVQSANRGLPFDVVAAGEETFREQTAPDTTRAS